LAFLSPLVQGALIVALGSALLLIPPSSDQIDKRLSSEWRALSPPMWFLGVYEMMAGDVLRNAPRSGLTPRKARADLAASAAYDGHRQRFATLARRAGTISLFTAALTV